LYLYWIQLKSKILTKKWGDNAFSIWLVVDIFMIILTAIIIFWFILAFSHPQIFKRGFVLKVVGALWIFAGILLSSAAVNKIGWARSFSLSIFTREKYSPEVAGLYKFSKHPMYVGWFLIFLGITLLLNSFYLLCYTLEGGIYFIIRSKLEERELDFL
jgi:protein-S-isoprenylcysteine O-methyltransferase Ste14